MTTICSHCGKLRHDGKECFPKKPTTHIYPRTTQDRNFVTLCGIAGDGLTSPIVSRSHEMQKINCIECKRLLNRKD